MKDECKVCGTEGVNVVHEDCEGIMVSLIEQKSIDTFMLRVCTRDECLSVPMLEHELSEMAHEILIVLAHKRLVEERERENQMTETPAHYLSIASNYFTELERSMIKDGKLILRKIATATSEGNCVEIYGICDPLTLEIMRTIQVIVAEPIPWKKLVNKILKYIKLRII